MIYRGLCTSCVHFGEDPETGDPACPGFPEGIPDEIIRLGFDHRNEYPGDGGYRFTPDGPADQDKIDDAVSRFDGGVGDDDAGTGRPDDLL